MRRILTGNFVQRKGFRISATPVGEVVEIRCRDNLVRFNCVPLYEYDCKVFWPNVGTQWVRETELTYVPKTQAHKYNNNHHKPNR